MSNLSSRQRKAVAALKKDFLRQRPDKPVEFWMGARDGYRDAMTTLYPDAETFMGEEPDATEMVLRYLALEELANGQ